MSEAVVNTTTKRGCPPRLIFEDGSRAMTESLDATIVASSYLHGNGTDDDPQDHRHTLQSDRGSVPLHEYYEIDRISQEILEICLTKNDEGTTGDGHRHHDQRVHHLPRILRIALQFPDELLIDSPDVCWLLDEKLQEHLTKRGVLAAANLHAEDDDTESGNPLDEVVVVPFCFVLGDTTANSCCPDEVAAFHLNADVLVHYGHACLSPTGSSLPILYSFGRGELDVVAAAQSLEDGRQRRRRQISESVTTESSDGNTSSEKFLILYQAVYHHAIKDLQQRWMSLHGSKDDDGDLQVLVGEIPTTRHNRQPSTPPTARIVSSSSTCCGNTGGHCNDLHQQPEGKDSSADATTATSTFAMGDSTSSRLEGKPHHSKDHTASTVASQAEQSESYSNNQRRPLIVGGLELPETIDSWDQLSDFTIVFVMTADPDADASTARGNVDRTPHSHQQCRRQYANSMLCLMSLPHPPIGGYWIYTPTGNSLTTDVIPPVALQRRLKRRFFLTQRARDASIFGILVANLSQRFLVRVVQSLQAIIQDAGRTSYSFAVGKVNPAKLANFAEIECFVLVACREQSLLDDEVEREQYPVPVITPMELEMALGAGNLQWGTLPYGLDCQDVMVRQHERGRAKQEGGSVDTREVKADNNDDDHAAAAADDDDDDAPYYSLVTGEYVSRQRSAAPTDDAWSDDLDLHNLPGRGQITEYKSEAAHFLKQREYQGLESLVGQTEARAAVPGLVGIASDYGSNRDVHAN
jgi:diphthamide biosynthesis protein 2